MIYPKLMAKSNTGFRDSSSGKTKYAFFKDLDEGEVSAIERFLSHYGRSVCLSANAHIAEHFSDELDFCLALDFNKPSPKEDRTQIGEWEYQAKYHQDKEALAALTKAMVAAVRSLPLRKVPKPRLISYVPCEADREFYLPAELAAGIVAALPTTFWGVDRPVVKSTLLVEKSSAKNLTVAEKIAQWEAISTGEGIALSRSVRGCSVIVVDDLYQSGASLWFFGKYLKDLGATVVVGLACVKSLRDTDNK
jgi:predicted amidophosphoribosyltransferase